MVNDQHQKKSGHKESTEAKTEASKEHNYKLQGAASQEAPDSQAKTEWRF